MNDNYNEANNIAEQLMRDGNANVRHGLYIEDVRAATKEFLADLEAIESAGTGVPCLRIGDEPLVPIAAFDPYFYRFRLPMRWKSVRTLRARYVRNLVRRWERGGDTHGVVDSKTAFQNFREGVSKFLSSRIASVVAYFEDSPGYPEKVRATPMVLDPKGRRATRAGTRTVGFNVRVHATPQLRIHVTPSFRIRWRYFGYPTTPAAGILTGGYYYFGADRGPYLRVTPDWTLFDIPYATVDPQLGL